MEEKEESYVLVLKKEELEIIIKSKNESSNKIKKEDLKQNISLDIFYYFVYNETALKLH